MFGGWPNMSGSNSMAAISNFDIDCYSEVAVSGYSGFSKKTVKYLFCTDLF